ncbi:protein of unknown function [Candidatus Hydrogenisulfobacillus filiaventi]|uniref:Uncharacterized protein n=1 Tax=Candidatus Hydrogenisulfobacillus filiaventi TaxID=2707344 RepID=A0A6F8ZIG9_9FIRM|nr:protein of unknown function [Candidatus Hydrogenisulfobacillus filiaventi]
MATCTNVQDAPEGHRFLALMLLKMLAAIGLVMTLFAGVPMLWYQVQAQQARANYKSFARTVPALPRRVANAMWALQRWDAGDGAHAFPDVGTSVQWIGNAKFITYDVRSPAQNRDQSLVIRVRQGHAIGENPLGRALLTHPDGTVFSLESWMRHN